MKDPAAASFLKLPSSISSEVTLEHTFSSPALWCGEVAICQLHDTFPYRDIINEVHALLH